MSGNIYYDNLLSFFAFSLRLLLMQLFEQALRSFHFCGKRNFIIWQSTFLILVIALSEMGPPRSRYIAGSVVENDYDSRHISWACIAIGSRQSFHEERASKWRDFLINAARYFSVVCKQRENHEHRQRTRSSANRTLLKIQRVMQNSSIDSLL